MPNFKRSLLSLSIAAGLVVSGTGVAAAQSSSLLPGSSLSTADRSDDDFRGRWPATSLKGKYETAYAKALKQKRLKQDEDLNEFAEGIADDLADGTLEYSDGTRVVKWQLSEDGTVAAEITRLTVSEAEAYLPRMNALLGDLLADKDPANDRLGYAVSSDNGHIYLVVSAPAGI